MGPSGAESEEKDGEGEEEADASDVSLAPLSRGGMYLFCSGMPARCSMTVPSGMPRRCSSIARRESMTISWKTLSFLPSQSCSVVNGYVE